jgi:hypothetical protein
MTKKLVKEKANGLVKTEHCSYYTKKGEIYGRVNLQRIIDTPQNRRHYNSILIRGFDENGIFQIRHDTNKNYDWVSKYFCLYKYVPLLLLYWKEKLTIFQIISSIFFF